MHHYITCKVRADSEEEALGLVKGELEDSLDPIKNNVGWDYVGDMEPITPEMLQNYKCKTFKELEKRFKKDCEDSLIGLKARLSKEVLPFVADRFLTKKEAPLYVSDEALNKIVEKLLKKPGKDKRTPRNFEEINAAIIDIMFQIAAEKNGMGNFIMRKIEELQGCINYPKDTMYTFQCTDNFFADLTDLNEGKYAFYIVGDRHF